MDRHPWTKNGQAPHTTTGVARASSIRSSPREDANQLNETPGMSPPIAMATNGRDSPRHTQNRLRMFRSSGFSSSSASTVRGSSAIPHFGQLPEWSCTTSGCIGQVYSIRVAGSVGLIGSRAIPHSGQSPGPFCRTSGCIGQVWSPWAVESASS